MTVPFTIGYSDHQSHGVYEELRKAYNERRAALGQGLRYWDASVCEWDDVVEEDIAVAVGDRIQNYKFFREIQQWIVNNCGYFLRPDVSSYSGVSYIKNMSELAYVVGGYPSAFEYLCKEVIGGNLVGTSDDFGFREWDGSSETLIRSDLSVAGSGHARGKVIAKLVGETPWCVTDDICTCLSALRATKIRKSATSEASDSTAAFLVPASGDGEYVEATDYYTGDNTNYDSQTPIAYGDYSYSFKQQSGSYGQHRENGACQVQYYIPPNNALISSAKLYYKVKKYGGDFSGFDIISHENAYNYVLSLPYTSAGELISPLILRLSGADFDNELVYQYSGLGFQAYGEAGVSDLIGVALWNFTNGIAWA
jgi:hypothetical protein